MDRPSPTSSVSAYGQRRGLYPENEPFAHGWLSTESEHEVYYEECGAPDGKPCVILHGGPGGAIDSRTHHLLPYFAL